MTKDKKTKKRRKQYSNNAFDPLVEELLLAPIAKEMAGKPLAEGLTEGSPLKNLIGRIVEMALKEEMQEHLGYEPNERTPVKEQETGHHSNVRNGYSLKTLKTSQGGVGINIPRANKKDICRCNW